VTEPTLDPTKLAAAKIWLTTPHSATAAGDAPYLATAVYALVTIPTSNAATVSADEWWRLYVNPAWVDRVEVPELAAHLAHVTHHLLLDHAARARSLSVGWHDREAWTIAADAGVAECLLGSSLTLAGTRLPEELGLPGGRSTEERFAVLTRMPAEAPVDAPGDTGGDCSDHCGSAADGLTRSYEAPASDSVPRIGTVHAEELRRTVAIAWSEHRGQRGDEPGEWRRWLRDVLEPTVAWEPVLAAAVRRAVAWSAGMTDYTYSRPSRRQAAVRGVVLPGMRRPVPDVAIVVDTSASVDDGLLARALGEVDGALHALGGAGSSVRVLATDAAAHSLQRVRRARDVALTGGGGTDMRVGLAAAADLRPRCDVCIVLTDGETPWPQLPPPAMAVLVGLLGRQREALPPTPAWAVRVECVPPRS
jgi:predicted metal-dependent peptidase